LGGGGIWDADPGNGDSCAVPVDFLDFISSYQYVEGPTQPEADSLFSNCFCQLLVRILAANGFYVSRIGFVSELCRECLSLATGRDFLPPSGAIGALTDTINSHGTASSVSRRLCILGLVERETQGRTSELTNEGRKIRLAVVSPFLDKRHGTERTVIEWLSRLPDYFEMRVYSERIEDLDTSRFTFRRIPHFPGPHILRFLWWFVANHLFRAWDYWVRGFRWDLVYSPGINCLDADVISVHIVFAEFLRQSREKLELKRNLVRTWPRLLHRRIYYRLITALERRVYANRGVQLVLYANKTANDLDRFYGRNDRMPVLYLGLDHDTFNPGRRLALRDRARAQLGVTPDQFALLLVGNDLRKKGLVALLDAMVELKDLPLKLLVAGAEDSGPFRVLAQQSGLGSRVEFLPIRRDIEFYYGAADAYVGPSLEDTFALPPEEAMACGLPVIVSAENGTSEIISNGSNGLILNEATDSKTLATMIRRLYEDPELQKKLGENAAESTRQYTWERNSVDLARIFEDTLRRKVRSSREALQHES
jgi:glycosyltransferase involved in cell wall biosynthesis